MTVKETLENTTDELIALTIVVGTMALVGYQIATSKDVNTVPLEPLMLILGYYFTKKASQ